MEPGFCRLGGGGANTDKTSKNQETCLLMTTFTCLPNVKSTKTMFLMTIFEKPWMAFPPGHPNLRNIHDMYVLSNILVAFDKFMNGIYLSDFK